MRAFRIAWLAAWFVAGSADAACPALFKHTFNSLVADRPVDFCQFAGKEVLRAVQAALAG